MKALLFTSLALLAFAGNSILCRMALAEGKIDAGSFTSIRLLSGIVMLVLIYLFKKNNTAPSSKGTWFASFMLFLYAVTFSYAYITLGAGTGALILFAAVQITILVVNAMAGNKLYFIEWAGVVTAFLGFMYLIVPNISTPSFQGFILMLVSGIAWAYYTLAGKASKGSTDPLAQTMFNFMRTLPLVILLTLFTFSFASLSLEGVILAVLAGSVTSGLGYAIWYLALRDISSVQAAVVQLLVPVIAAIAGVMFLQEDITLRLAIASLCILLGILMVTLGKHYYLRLSGQN